MIIGITLDKFSQAVKEGCSVSLTDGGLWDYVGLIHGLWAAATWQDTTSSLAQKMITNLERVERLRIPVNSDPRQEVFSVEKWVNACKAVAQRLKGAVGKNSLYRNLKFQQHALFYRKQPDRAVDKTHEQILLESASRWKKAQTWNEDQIYGEGEVKAIQVLLTFPKIAKQMANDSALFDEYLDWTVVNQCPPKVFLLYPSSSRLLALGFLAADIGTYGGLTRGFVTIGDCKYQDLTLLVDGEACSLLGLEYGQYLQKLNRESLRVTLQSFASHTHASTDYIYGPKGLVPWNAYELGRRRRNGEIDRDLSPQALRENIPDMECTMPWQEFSERYLSHEDVGEYYQGHAFIVLAAHREHRALEIEGTHAWLEFWEPQGDSYRLVNSSGFWPLEDPQSGKDRFLFGSNTVEGRFVSPEKATISKDKEKTGKGFAVPPGKEDTYFEVLGRYMKLGIEGKLPFQSPSDLNCAARALTVLGVFRKEVGLDPLPNYFAVPMEEVQTKTGLAPVIKFYEQLPPSQQSCLRCVLATIQLGFRSREGVGADGSERIATHSVFRGTAVKEGVFTLPAGLFPRKEKEA